MSNQIYPELRQVVVFTLDDLVYALTLDAVIRVIHVVEVTKLPKAPDIVSGIINVKGLIVPVIDVRKRFGFASRELDPEDQFIITNTGKREIALWVDKVTGIKEVTPQQLQNTRESIPYAEYISGVAKIEDDLILIYDLERFLNLEEEKELEEALSKTE